MTRELSSTVGVKLPKSTRRLCVIWCRILRNRAYCCRVRILLQLVSCAHHAFATLGEAERWTSCFAAQWRQLHVALSWCSRHLRCTPPSPDLVWRRRSFYALGLVRQWECNDALPDIKSFVNISCFLELEFTKHKRNKPFDIVQVRWSSTLVFCLLCLPNFLQLLKDVDNFLF